MISDGKKKWKRYNAPLFHHNIGYSFKSIRPNEILPLCLFLVIFGSAVFSIFALNNALNKSAWRNHKYDSIEFGHLKTVLEKEATNPDLRSSAIGKKHALKKYDQFALNTSCFWGICAISRNFCYKNSE